MNSIRKFEQSGSFDVSVELDVESGLHEGCEGMVFCLLDGTYWCILCDKQWQPIPPVELAEQIVTRDY